MDNSIDEILLVEDEDNSVVNANPMELELEGVLIREELDTVLNIVKRDGRSDSAIPLFIKFNGSREFIGDFSLTLENVLKLVLINPQYKLTLRDNVNNQTMEMLDGISDNTCYNLEKLISL